MYGMRNDELRLVPYDLSWKADFQEERNRILRHLGENDVRVEHVGSTAIEWVYAKPILDIAVMCGSESHFLLTRSLPSLGYDYRGQFEDEEEHFYAVRDEGEMRLCQMHIYTSATDDWNLKLRFRDVLRADRGLAKEYNDYKLSLAASVADKKTYAEIKHNWVTGFIPKVLRSAAIR